MTISLRETVEAVRRAFRDVKWRDERLEAWVQDGVRDYANHFPRMATWSGQAVSGTYQYAFEAVCLGVMAVEYPAGEDPPEYPWRHNHTREDFFGDGISYYDVVSSPGLASAVLWLSQPESGSNFQVRFLTDYTWTVDGDETTTQVPDLHRPAIVQYAAWCCWREMLTIEKEKGELESKYNVLAERAARERETYETMISVYRAARPRESRVMNWVMDRYDRIY